MLKAAGVEEDWIDRDGNTAATVGSEMPGKLTKWAEAKRIKDAEEAAKREAEMAAAAAAAQAAGPDEPDYDDDWDDEVRLACLCISRLFAQPSVVFRMTFSIGISPHLLGTWC